jgi:hypothetical protein
MNYLPQKLLQVIRAGMPPRLRDWREGNLQVEEIRDARIRRSTIEALEATAALIGFNAAAERLLGPSPKKAED